MLPWLGRSVGNDDVYIETNELLDDLGIAFSAPLRPSVLDRNGSTFNPAVVTEPLDKRGAHRAMIAGVLEPKNPMVGNLPAC